MLPLECFVTGERAAALLCLSPAAPTQTLRLLFLPPDFSRPVSPVRGNVPRVPLSAYLWHILQHLLIVAAPLRSKEKKRVTLLQSDGCNLSNSPSPNCRWHQNVFLVFSLWRKVTVEGLKLQDSVKLLCIYILLRKNDKSDDTSKTNLNLYSRQLY